MVIRRVVELAWLPVFLQERCYCCCCRLTNNTWIRRCYHRRRIQGRRPETWYRRKGNRKAVESSASFSERKERDESLACSIPIRLTTGLPVSRFAASPVRPKLPIYIIITFQAFSSVLVKEERLFFCINYLKETPWRIRPTDWISDLNGGDGTHEPTDS